MNSWKIIEWDVLTTPWPVEWSESVQCVVTSPPYWGLRDYGVPGQLGLERTPEEYVEKMVAVFREVRRVLRKDGTVWLNLGDSYAHSSSGSDVRNVGGFQGEQIRANPKMADAYQTRKKDLPDGLKPKDLVGIPWRVAFALQADGWWLRSDIVWAKPNPMPESIRDRPTRAHEYIFLLTKSERYYYDQDAIREPLADPEALARIAAQGANARTVWTIPTEPYPEAHFATFPTELARRCILAGTKEGDLVLDPFAGSGTTLLVADTLGRLSVGLELNPEYVALAEKRLLAPRSKGEAIPLAKEALGQLRCIE